MFNVKLKEHCLRLPIIQGGMGVGISLSGLASAVINQGCLGVISAAQPGYREEDFYKNNFQANMRALQHEIDTTRANTNHQGVLGVNVMVAGRRYKETIQSLSKMDIDAIISGAGLPLDLPELVTNDRILLAPIVSSGKATQLICRVWDKRYKRIPDFIVIEGPDAGGHLGFKVEDLLNDKTQSLDEILADVMTIIKPFEQKYGVKIPLFVAGGITTGSDIAHYLKRGATGVQMGTAFAATVECDADNRFKQAIIDAKSEDIGFTKSPSKLHGRALRTKFMTEVNAKEENVRIKRCVSCLQTCNPMDTPYCITQALISSVQGNVDEGIVFVGTSAAKIDRILSVSQLISNLEKELRSAYE